MAEPLKDSFDAAMVGRIGADLHTVDPTFDVTGFVAEATRDFASLGLSGRAAAVSQALVGRLPEDPAVAIGLIRRSLPPESETSAWQGMEGFRLWPFTMFIAEHGLDCFEESMAAQYDITRRFTAEFSIRTFIDRRYGATMGRLHDWVSDPSPAVRRLVSEGTRPRLPWAPVLRRFVDDPAPVLPLLEQLKDDGSEYVRRSVANNLNDIARDHPDITLDVCERWMAPERRRLVRHALRGLVKAGDARALSILGFAADTPARVDSCVVEPTSVRIGDTVAVDVMIVNPSRSPTPVAVDLQVWFVRPGGHHRKVFKGAEFELPARGRRSLRRRVSLGQLSTRTVHPGEHRVVPLVNGVASGAVAFQVTD